MVSCDYNGWTDVPEDEREGLDRYSTNESEAFDRTDQLQADLRSAANRADGGRLQEDAMTLTSQRASSRPGVALPRRPLASILIQVLELVMAALFLYLGGTKLLGSPAAVRLFHDYGWGQWFRYVTGVVELAGALLLIVPRLARASALMAVMVVAMWIELFVLHRPPVAATACLSAHGIIAWKRQGARLRRR